MVGSRRQPDAIRGDAEAFSGNQRRHLAKLVEKRPAAVARVDRRVRLDEVDLRSRGHRSGTREGGVMGR